VPRGRFINKKIVDDYRLNNVSVEAELLYYKMITHTDCEGRLKADPKLVNNKFYSLRSYLDEQVCGWLKELSDQRKNGYGLIELYEVEGYKYLWMPGFEGEQIGLRKEKEAPSEIPPPSIKTKKIISKRDIKDKVIIADKEFSSEWLQALKEEFSDVEFDEEVKKFDDYWTDGNRDLKNPKLGIRNWMIKARDIKKAQQPDQDDDKPIKGLTIR